MMLFDKPKRSFVFLVWPAIFCFLFLTGCQSAAEKQASEAVVAFQLGNYDHAEQLLTPLAKDTNENFVLNNARLGSSALAAYHLRDAEDAFLRAYEVINSVGVNNGGRSLGAVLIDEKIKVWKGEPFERAMVNFYLGLIYYMNHDYNNARAAFENALFKLKDYGDPDKPDQYAEIDSNFTLGYIMLAKSWQRLGNEEKAREYFNKVATLRPDLAALANEQMNGEANMLIVADSGQGPLKRTNMDGAIVGFGPTPWQAGPIHTPHVYVDGQIMSPPGTTRPPVDLLELAQDRKWESIDTIRTIKSVVGTGLLAAGAYEASQGRRQNVEIGAGLLAAGLLLKATSQADIRQWEMLPRTVFVMPLHVSPGAHDVTVEFPSGLRQTWHGLIAPAVGDNTYYMRMNPYRPGPFHLTSGDLPYGSAPATASPPNAPPGPGM